MHDTIEPFKAEIQNAFNDLSDHPCIIHSDIFRIGIPFRQKISKNELWSIYEEALTGACRSGLVIPTFNYDFCGNGIYDVKNSVSQIGVLSDLFRANYYHKRSVCPIFNAVSIGYDFQGQDCKNVFGDNSLFDSLAKDNATVCFLGAGFDSNTFIHYVEELNDIPYRYLKTFRGEVVMPDGIKITKDILYRVRPMMPDACEYRWRYLEEELEKEGLLKSKKIVRGYLKFFNANEVIQFWTQKIKQNQLYLLSKKSQIITRALFKKFGSPLTVDVEEYTQ